MPLRSAAARDTSIRTYRAKRDFARTSEPAPQSTALSLKAALKFVVQKHAARRLHWDFRLEHGGVLWSWAVPKGPSLDPADKRLAVRVEDHPLEYATFEGTIAEGNYGAGTVEIWDAGEWAPLGDPVEDLERGELKLRLNGTRLRGGFVLVRLRHRGGERAENWLLIKEHDAEERQGVDAEALELEPGPQVAPAATEKAKTRRKTAAAPTSTPGTLVAEKPAAAPSTEPAGDAPYPGAVRGLLPESQKPELATLVGEPPEGDEWISEVKFDGYRLLAWKEGRQVRLITRNGQDWTAKLPDVARAVASLKPKTLLLDGELVALREDGLSSFAALQAALANGGSRKALFFYAFDLLHLEGWDLRGCRLVERKAALKSLSDWGGALRYSDHLEGESARVRKQACALGLEGIICKQANSPYRAARTRDWVKVKCQGREEFVVLGWTPPAGSRTGLGSLHLGFYDEQRRLRYVGGVGTGFSEAELRSLTRRLSAMPSTPPEGLLFAGEPPDPAIRWVRPELVAEVEFIGWTGFGRVRHATYLGLRQDKEADEVVRDVPPSEVEPQVFQPCGQVKATIVHATAPKRGSQRVGAVQITHAERELWPGVTKVQLADYWRTVAEVALPGIAGRPLALLRCPEGIEGERFFQKHGNKGMPSSIRDKVAAEGPYLALDTEEGLVACAQMSAIELHVWGSPESDTAHPDHIVFDLDPGEGVPFADVVEAAKEVRARLKKAGLESFCRTTGGKGLHVVAPIQVASGWLAVRAFCRHFAATMEAEMPDRFVSTVSKAKRRGRILVDWLRNGPGATAVASYSPRARPGAPVATPLSWREVTAKLDPMAFTLATVPARLKRLKADLWQGYGTLQQSIPEETP